MISVTLSVSQWSHLTEMSLGWQCGMAVTKRMSWTEQCAVEVSHQINVLFESRLFQVWAANNCWVSASLHGN